MVRLNEVRRNEIAVEAPASFDAGLTFIGVIRTPWTSRLECPRQGRADGPICRIEVTEPWVAALDGIEAFERIEVLYWLHESRRDLVRQSPANDGETRGDVCAALAGSAEPDRDGARRPGRAPRADASGQGSGLPRQDAARRPQARPVPVHAACAAPDEAISRRGEGSHVTPASSVAVMRVVSCEFADRFSRPATANRRMAISESILSDSKGLRRHFRVVVAPNLLVPQGAARTLRYAPSGRSRNAHFARRNETFRRAWRKSLKSL